MQRDRNPFRTFHNPFITLSLLSLLSLLVFTGGGCTTLPQCVLLGVACPGDEPSADDDSVADDDLPDGPGDDDDATDAPEEPANAPCFGIQVTDTNFDCDPVPNAFDVFNTDPESPRVLWHDSIAPDGTNLREVGFGHGTATEDGWLWQNGQAVLFVGDWVIVEVSPGVYRVNLRAQNGAWGQFGNYCENGVWLDDGNWVMDPACVFDAGCQAQDIQAGWAMAFRATNTYTRRLTNSEIDALPLAEENCPQATQ